jgi:hypothetical protein
VGPAAIMIVSWEFGIISQCGISGIRSGIISLSYKITHLVGPGSREESAQAAVSPDTICTNSVMMRRIAAPKNGWMPQLRFFCSCPCSEFLSQAAFGHCQQPERLMCSGSSGPRLLTFNSHAHAKLGFHVCDYNDNTITFPLDASRSEPYGP